MSATPRRDGANIPVVIVAFVASVAVAVGVLYAAGVIFPPGPEPVRTRVTLEPVSQGLEQPVGVLGAGDGSGRLYVLEQAGRVRVVEPDGSLAPTPLLDLRSRVLAGGERGLLGMALHPAFQQNGRLFVAYSRRPDGTTILSELQVGEGTADPGSERVLLAIEQPFDTHKAGNLVFDAEGMLIMGVGDGGGPGDPFGRALDPAFLLGKLLRLDVDSGDPYGIPPGNGWAGADGARGEVHAIGLRNPWRFSFDHESGRLIIGDVGAREWEEINVLTPSRTQASFGWSSMEGPDCFKVAGCQPWAHLPAAIAYNHVEPDMAHCAVIGGHTYRGGADPALAGVYLYGDLCSGIIWGVRAADILHPDVTPARVGRVDPAFGLLHSFGEDDAGELYAVTSGGYLLRLRDAETTLASARG